MKKKNLMINNILNFWFFECTEKDWFKKDLKFDQLIQKKFLKSVKDALQNKLNLWENSSDGCLALILLLDQFTRNIYREDPKSFSGDDKALEISLNCIETGFLQVYNEKERQFIMMPMMHSEDLSVQENSLLFFKKYSNEKVFDFALKHRDIIKRFGRFPHRNKILSRPSTEEELEFLKKPGSSF
tara:strand:- start:1705 stop:2259 length:555 start_codon:yes stop_codon:yes gene_type:complete